MNRFRWSKLVLLAAAGSILGMILAAALPTQYVAERALAIYSKANDIEHCVRSAVEYCNSWKVLTGVIHRENLYAPERERMSDEDVVSRIRKDLQFGVLNRNGTIDQIRVTFAYSDHSAADRVLTTVINALEVRIHSCPSDPTGTPVAVDIAEMPHAQLGGTPLGRVAAVRVHAPNRRTTIPLRADLRKAVLDQHTLERVVVEQRLGDVRETKSIEQAISRLRRSLAVEDDPQWPGTLRLRYEDKNPERAMRTLNGVVESVVDENFRIRALGETTSIVWMIDSPVSGRPQSRFGMARLALLGGVAGLLVGLGWEHARRAHLVG